MRRLIPVILALSFFVAPAATAVSASTLSYTFALDPSGVSLIDDSPDGVKVAIEGYEPLEYFGYPSLPYRIVRVLLPQGESVSAFDLEVRDEIDVAPGGPLAVYRGRVRDDGATAGLAASDRDLRTEEGLYPKWRVRHLGTSRYRGYAVASFALYPVRCDLESGGLLVAREVRLTVETAGAAIAEEGADRRRFVEGFREESRREVERMVVNPEAAAGYLFDEIGVDPESPAFLPSYEPSMEGSEVAYLIVTNEEMAPAFQRLADWKTRKGIPAVVRTVEWIGANARTGADLAESVRNYIRDAYEKWGVEWVLLGGDTDVIPVRFAFMTFYTGELIPTDMYYACLDGTWNADADSLWGEAYQSVDEPGDACDLYAEVYLGRMPASSAAEASVLVNKTLNYETPAAVDYQRKTLLLGEVIFFDETTGEVLTDGAEIVESVYTLHLAGRSDVTTSRLYENYPAFPGSVPLTKEVAVDSLDAGTNHVLHAGHGYKYNMSVGDASILNYDASTLANGTKLFSMYLLNCTNLAFDTDCLAEYFLLNANGGAYAVTGATRSAFPSASRPYLDNYYHLLYGENVVQLGKVFTQSREPFTASAEGETADRWTHFIYNYLGDPESCMFQGAARTFAVTKPTSAVYGANDINISVRSGGFLVDSAYVCVYKPGDDYRFGAADNGMIAFNDFLVKSSGYIYFTVTGLNHCRYRDSIMVAAQTPAYLRFNRARVEDVVVGNGDDALDAGETADLEIELMNTGFTGATKLYAKIRSRDPLASVLDSTAVYPDIGPYQKAFGTDPFRIAVGSSSADGHALEFSLEVRDSTGGLWSERFAIEAHGPSLELFVNTVSDTLPYGDNDGVIEANESYLVRIGVKNFGTGEAYGLAGTLASSDPDVTIVDGTASYDPVQPFGTRLGQGFVIREKTVAESNYLTFTLTDAYGRAYSRRIELRRPGAPSTLVLNSGYGPYEMHATWRAPDGLDSYRYRVYRADASGGPYSAVSADLVLYTLFRDLGLASSTRYYYVVTAVDSCGNEGPPSAERWATTNPPQLAGWPNKVDKETASSVKIGDINGDTHPDVVVGSNYVYAWRSDGVEVRDGDGQPITWGIFNTLGSNFTATVALANLDGAQGLEIIGASWDTKQIYIFKKDGSVLAGWPKTTSYLCWASPVVGDFDGNGDLEIFAYDVGGIVYAWHHDGTEVRDGDGNPATNGPFFVTKNPGTWHIPTPAFADIDADGVGELVICSPYDSVYCLNYNGSRVPGWPVKLVDQNVTSSPAVGDVDGDGRLEIMVTGSAGWVDGLNHDGTLMTGWHKWVYLNTNTIAPSTALADLNDDGRLEVIVAALDSKVYIWSYNGAIYPGWPQPYATSGASESSPVVIDIDGDGSLDIIAGSEEGRLSAWNQAGQYIAGFPIQIGSFLRGTPVAADLDFDGDIDLATSCWDQNVYIWDVPGAWSPEALAWNGFRSNIYNSGLKDFAAATAVGQIACVYRFADGMIELNWSVPADGVSWNLLREGGDEPFEIIAEGLRSEAAMISFVDAAAEPGIVYRYRLEAVDDLALSATTDEIMIPVSRAHLYQNHPNPFNPSTTMSFTVPGGVDSRSAVHLAVYDVAGALVKTLVSGALPGGRHEARWDGCNERGREVSSGIYFAKLQAVGERSVRKLVLLR